MSTKMITLFKKLALFSYLYLATWLVYAADSFGVSQIDNNASIFENGVWVTIKWGGIISIAGAFIHLYRNRGQPQAADTIFWLALALGIALFLIGWWMQQPNISGFAF